MVNHDFICDACGHQAINVLCDYPPEKHAPEHCGQPMTLNWMSLPQSVQEFVPFTTRNIRPDGEPMEIKCKGDLEFAAREYGVRHFDDPNLVAQGDQIVRKTPKIGKVFDMGGR